VSSAASSLILDLDGTLIDSRAGIVESFGVAAAAVFPGRPFDPNGVELGPPIQRMFENFFPEAPKAQIDQLLGAFRGHYDREGSLKSCVYEGALELLTYCQRRGISVDIATNKPLHISRQILAHLKLDHFFRSLTASDSIEPRFAGKSELLRHVLEAHRLNASRSVYVGDSKEDAAAAIACEVPFVWAAYGYGKAGEIEPHFIHRTIKSLPELIPLLG
jgi:phosphoglycolate phosphatase